ncbi:MAG TPA: SdpI family protein, partial [Saprospiraceae bacterium]|nr:SdpI family protein [Saprospiraceae bacterium]
PLILLIGIVTRYFSPKKINNLYGYRTKRSMKNMDTWQFANNYTTNIIIVSGLFTTLIQLIFWRFEVEDFLLISLTAFVMGLGLSILLTERKLKQTFDEEGNRLNP